jgi:two-component system sensor histidine kinase BarA
MLGETSLERKCRLLFGVALMILLTASFWMFHHLTRRIVESQQVGKARELVVPDIMYRWHVKKWGIRMNESTAAEGTQTLPPEESGSADELFATDFLDRLGRSDKFKLDVEWGLILKGEVLANDREHEAFVEFEQGGTEKYTFEQDADGKRYLNYYQPIKAVDECLDCHNGKRLPAYAKGDPIAMATVRMPMENVENQLSHNRAIMFGLAIITTFIAMLVAYIIVRYIIVKPVLHLKDVSDEIARGNLNLRAEINTGDEFEELSHAFNRMLRHMTTVNDELRGVNGNLDAKVDQLAQANLELFNNNALKDEFLATMSHELRTPLNSILGFSDVLSSAANLDDRQKRYVENIQTSGRNLMVQINDLLDLAKIESGQMKIQPTTFQVSELIEHQINQIMPLADQKNIELRIREQETTIPHVYQDAGKIRQILTNLLSNAIKFTPEGGRVRVSSELITEDTFELCIEDTGIGIPMHEQGTIFEKFRQGTTTSGERDHVKREYGGTGLGLSIVRELSRLLGGDVFLESEFGKGSVFMVRLPVEVPLELPVPDLSLDSPSGPGLNRITSADLLNTRTGPAEGAAERDSDVSTVVDGEEAPSHA